MLVRSPRAPKVGAVISICGAGEFAVEAPGVERRLELRFDDVDVEGTQGAWGAGTREARLRAWARRKFAAEAGRVEVCCTMEDARRIVEFAGEVQNVEGVVLCHCRAGISRSAAAGLLCLATWMGEGKERESVAELMRVRPGAVPLVGLVRFGDEVLGRGGRLVGAAVGARRG